jgi:hypothetical protein
VIVATVGFGTLGMWNPNYSCGIVSVLAMSRREWRMEPIVKARQAQASDTGYNHTFTMKMTCRFLNIENSAVLKESLITT